MRAIGLGTAALLVLLWGTACPAWAQTTHPQLVVEVHAGYAGFVDEVWDKRGAIGAAVRGGVTRRLAVGPEFVYLAGRHGEHDWTLTMSLSFDLRATSAGTGSLTATAARRVTPYLVIGGGLLSQTRRTGVGPFTTMEGTFSGGGGVRIQTRGRWFVAPEVRLGYEPELRITVAIGRRLGG